MCFKTEKNRGADIVSSKRIRATLFNVTIKEFKANKKRLHFVCKTNNLKNLKTKAPGDTNHELMI